MAQLAAAALPLNCNMLPHCRPSCFLPRTLPPAGAGGLGFKVGDVSPNTLRLLEHQPAMGAMVMAEGTRLIEVVHPGEMGKYRGGSLGATG
jgi:hypothetical protein